MTLEQDVRNLLDKLLATPWGPVFAKQGVSAQTEFSTVLTVDRTEMGFHDFSMDKASLIQPGDPAASLLYHCLASPVVRPPDLAQSNYPTQEELDLVENYIYSLVDVSDELRNTWVAAVFAYEYREAAGTPHRMHADLVFSRTGIARVGSAPAIYDPVLRSYRLDAEVAHEVRVMPARYAAFLCERIEGSELDGCYLGPSQFGDSSRQFLVPIVKIFPGLRLDSFTYETVELSSYHFTDRLRRLFSVGKLPNIDKADLNRPPYTRSTRNNGLQVNAQAIGATLVVHPQPQPLVREVIVEIKRGKDQPGATTVPAKGPGIEAYNENRRYSTLRVGQKLFSAGLDYISAEIIGLVDAKVRPFLSPRNCSEFINMRHRLTHVTGTVDDVNITISGSQAFESLLDAGGYDIALYLDDICDGYVNATYSINGHVHNVSPAFSVITAPDFFPYVGNLELKKFSNNFSEGGPSALCEGRLGANARMTDPDTGAAVFTSDDTIVSVVSRGRHRLGKRHYDRWVDVPTALSDGASNVFAPGWDVTYGRDSVFSAPYYHTAGLGSPFVEDAKLCAAANGMWAAASPDASRTFNRAKTPTAIPLTDEELGLHPESPGAINGQTVLGWDGEYGPFLVEAEGAVLVNYSDIMRADYVSNALSNRLVFDKLRAVGGTEMQSRLHAFAIIIEKLDGPGAKVSQSSHWLVVFRSVKSWADLKFEAFLPLSILDQYKSSEIRVNNMSGSGYLFVFADGAASPQHTNDPKRLMVAVSEIKVLIWDRDTGKTVKVEGVHEYHQ
ncbi:hypothetical protein [Pseudomonas frederiksbergensis]|uniref:Uncharacterized protein n=1 Tax=Pseudomonas frederiksbergensis TaxID=104087 RepID=A0A423KKQ1_9PSED|nr:hypothetical protein [Pseudomonas frederiksbergensis]RON53958.1 hypothetical protein BK665_13745 [Pseudomonas frederiksbergensis]